MFRSGLLSRFYTRHKIAKVSRSRRFPWFTALHTDVSLKYVVSRSVLFPQYFVLSSFSVTMIGCGVRVWVRFSQLCGVDQANISGGQFISLASC